MEAVVGSAVAAPTVEALAGADTTAADSAAVIMAGTAAALAVAEDRCMEAVPEVWAAKQDHAVARNAAHPTVAPIPLPDGIRSADQAACLPQRARTV